MYGGRLSQERGEHDGILVGSTETRGFYVTIIPKGDPYCECPSD